MSNFALTLESGNRKTGKMPVSTSHKGTCPDSCPFKVKGCYAKGGYVNIHWSAVTREERGSDWKTFCQEVASLPEGTIFRHNQAGDLVGRKDRINLTALRQLMKACSKLKAYTYTHYPLSKHNIAAIRLANTKLTVNVSTNEVDEVDYAISLGLPTVTVLPFGYTKRITHTTQGNVILTCPASLGKKVSCKDCTLCQKSERPYAIGFIAHGPGKKTLG